MYNVMIQTMEWTSKYQLVNTLNIYTLNFEHLENEPEPYFYMFIQLLKAPATFPTITGSSRGLKSVCKFFCSFCKNFAQFLQTIHIQFYIWTQLSAIFA